MDPITSGLIRMAGILLNKINLPDYKTDEERARQRKAEEEERIRSEYRSIEEDENKVVAFIFLCGFSLLMTIIFTINAYYRGWGNEDVKWIVKFVVMFVISTIIVAFLKIKRRK